jgi:hypothetical protein
MERDRECESSIPGCAAIAAAILLPSLQIAYGKTSRLLFLTEGNRLRGSAALAGGLAWAILAFCLVWRWISSFDWGDTHRFALVLGGVVAWMLGGFVVFKVAGALRIDWIGKGVLNAAAAIWLFSLWPLGGRRT